jgi:hypothetical protein
MMENLRRKSSLMKQLTISTLVMISSGSNDISSSAPESKTEDVIDEIHLSNT